jgi:hypothetical protein
MSEMSVIVFTKMLKAAYIPESTYTNLHPTKPIQFDVIIAQKALMSIWCGDLSSC